MSDAPAPDLIESPEIAEIARRYGIPAAIHPDDYLFLWHKHHPARSPSDTLAAAVYFETGHDSATRFLWLIDRIVRPEPGRVSVLEFASGYGCVSRHLQLHDRLDVVPCDIHGEAVTFLRTALGLPALGSTMLPDAFDPGRRFEIVFALSFLTHMPRATWTAWLTRLFDLVEPGGAFIFTAHGFKPWQEVGSPAIETEGFWFLPDSEQKDLPGEDYGCTVTLPHFVFNAIRALPGAELIFYRPDYWGDHQDTYVLRRVPEPANDVAGQQEQVAKLTAELAALRASTSWRVTRPRRALGRWMGRGGQRAAR